MFCALFCAAGLAGAQGTTGTQPNAVQISVVNKSTFDPDARVEIGSVNTTQALTFRVLDAEGNPIRNLAVTPKVVVEPEGAQEPMRFFPEKEVTNAVGEYTVNVLPGERPGRYVVLFFHGAPEGQASTPQFTRFEFISQETNWPTMLVLSLAGGLAIFLYGMRTASDGLQSYAGGRLRALFSHVSKNAFVSVLLGAIITAFTQSSGATTVMLMSFVRAKLLSFRNSVGIVLGAAIGGTITVQLISFNLFAYALPAVAVGFAFHFMSKRAKMQAIGQSALGFGLLFFGMKIMTDQMAPLKSFPFFRQAVDALSDHPVWAMLFSGLFTAAAQSSGAMLGVVLSLSRQNLITLHDAVPMFLGASIGICFTGITASLGAPVEAKRVAYAHLIYKVVGALVFLPFISYLAWAGGYLTQTLGPTYATMGDFTTRAIANTYTLYITTTALLALPLIPLLERVTKFFIPDAPEYASGETRTKYLDLQMRDTPEIAVGAARREISRMGRFVEEMMKYIILGLTQKDEKVLEFVRQRDNKVDRLNRDITHYLTDLTKRSRNEADSRRALDLLYIVSDLESIGDIIDKNLVPLSEKMIVHDYDFSEDGKRDLKMLHQKVSERLSEMVIALATGDQGLANDVLDGFEVLQNEGKRFHLRHLQRLQDGLRESIETSSIHLDAINYFLRIDYLIFNICLHVAGKAKQPMVIDMSE